MPSIGSIGPVRADGAAHWTRNRVFPASTCLGTTLLKQTTRDAVACLDQRWGIDPRDSGTDLNLGSAELAQSRKTEALRHPENSITLAPKGVQGARPAESRAPDGGGKPKRPSGNSTNAFASIPVSPKRWGTADFSNSGLKTPIPQSDDSAKRSNWIGRMPWPTPLGQDPVQNGSGGRSLPSDRLRAGTLRSGGNEAQ